MRKMISWPIDRDNFSKEFMPLNFDLNIPLETAIIVKKEDTKEKKMEEKETKRKIKFTVFGKVDTNELKKISKFNNLSDVHFTCHIPFHCCDKCGAGFGVVDYPDGKYDMPDPKPILLKTKTKTYELCESCFTRHKEYEDENTEEEKE